MHTDNHHRWMYDFLDEMGLPLRAELLGYVLYEPQQNAYIAGNNTVTAPSSPQPLVKPCAWAHCYPCIVQASNAANTLGAEYEIHALFQLDSRYLSCPL